MTKRLILFFITLTLLATFAGTWFAVLESRRIEQEQYLNLRGVAKLKSEQIANWLNERQGDGENLLVSRNLISIIQKLIQNPNDAATTGFLNERLNTLLRTYGYSSVLLLAGDGRLLLASGGDKEMPESAKALLQIALTRGQIQHSDLYLDPAGSIRMDWIIPMIAKSAAGNPAHAAILLRVDPRTFLYPMLEAWPVNSASAETLLVRKENADSLIYLNDLRHAKNTALKFRLPLFDSRLPAAVGVNAGQSGVVKGRDYRGVEVLAAYRPVPGTNWHIIAKVDRDEVLAPIRQTLRWIAAISLAALASIFAAFRNLLRYAEKAKANQMLMQFFDLPFLGMAVTAPDTQKWLRVNDRLCDMLGYSRSELTGMTWLDISAPGEWKADEDRFAAMRLGEIDHFNVGKSLIHKSGARFDALIDVRCGRAPNGEVEHFIATIEDITDRLQAETRLRESEERFRAVTENSPLAIFIYTGADQRFSYINPVSQRLLGYTLEDMQSVADWWPLAYPDADYRGRISDEWARRVAEAIEHRQPMRPMESIVACKDGSTRTILWNHMNIGEQHLVYGLDMTGVKQAENAREISERKFQIIAESAPSAIIVTDAAVLDDQKLLYLNPRFTELFGYSLEDFSSVSDWWPVAYPDEAVREELMRLWHRDIEEAFRNQTAVKPQEAIVTCKDGSRKNIEFRLASSGDVNVIFGSDVTERRSQELELQQYRSHLEELVEAKTHELQTAKEAAETIGFLSDQALELARAGYWRIDFSQGGDYYISSERTVEIFGDPPRDDFRYHIMNDWYVNIAAADPAAAEATLANYLDAVAGKTPRYDMIHPYRRPSDGAVIWVRVLGRVVRNPQGEPAHVHGVVMDVTAAKLAEIAIGEAKDLAVQAAKAKGEFLANMSHEIRTPLNAVIGLAKMSIRDNRGGGVQDNLIRILEAGRHLLSVVNDVLDFSKIEAGKMTLDRHSFRLMSLINDAASLVDPRVREKQLILALELQPKLPVWVLGDSLRLRQIIVNLLSNAVKFTQQGHVILAVGYGGGEVRISVTDTGIGMSPEQLNQLFSAFTQGDNSTTRQFGGSGLGLAISKNLARIMGGDITVSSTLGVGSEFVFHAPLPETMTGEADWRAAGQAGDRLASLRILAAEDVELNRIVLEDLLTHEGAHVDFAENGRQLLDRLEETGYSAYDVVLMDVQMPVMDGYQTTREILKFAPTLPVIGLTAHAMPEERQRCLEAGMRERVTKPVDADELISAILRYLPGKPLAAAPAAEGSVPLELRIPAETGTAGLIDWPAVFERYDGREAFIEKLIGMALNGVYREQAAKLRQAASDRDYEPIRFVAHGLKGLAGAFESQVLLAQAQQTEQAAKNQEAPAVTLASQLAETLEELLREMRDYRPGG